MTVGSALRELGRFLEEFEQRVAVTTIDVVDGADSSGVDGLTAEVELTVETRSSADATGEPSGASTATSSPEPDGGGGAELISLVSTTVGDDGRLHLGFETAEPLVPTADHDVTVEPAGATVGDDGTAVVRLAVSVPTDDDPTSDGTDDRGGRTSGNATDESDAATDGERGSSSTDRGPGLDSDSGAGAEAERTVPPFRDPDLLASVYESCETFAEMADRIDMDVTAETVRRYMIDYDIHQPNTYATASTRDDETPAPDTEGETSTLETEEEVGGDAEAAEPTEPTERPEATERSPAERTKSTTRTEADADESETPVVLADGIGLPNDVAVETLVEAVKRSNTIYDVERHVGVDREEAVELLRELDLLDLVVGRLATEAQRDISRTVVVDRLREASATRS
jgi:hypothetical protein